MFVHGKLEVKDYFGVLRLTFETRKQVRMRFLAREYYALMIGKVNEETLQKLHQKPAGRDAK